MPKVSSSLSPSPLENPCSRKSCNFGPLPYNVWTQSSVRTDYSHDVVTTDLLSSAVTRKRRTRRKTIIKLHMSGLSPLHYAGRMHPISFVQSSESISGTQTKSFSCEMDLRTGWLHFLFRLTEYGTKARSSG